MTDAFKGIALFTPAGDVIYARDRQKQGRWHSHLCVALKEILGLSEPPYFLVPSYTATLDRWFDARTQQMQVYAELHPPLRRYSPFLNTLFQTPNQVWEVIPWYRSQADPFLLENYREEFAPLWTFHHLVIDYQEWIAAGASASTVARSRLAATDAIAPVLPAAALQSHMAQKYVLRLFVSGQSLMTERLMKQLYELLEHNLDGSYTLKIIDILKNPEQAELDQVTATPTLLRLAPKPIRRIVGELDSPELLLELLLTD